MAGWKSAESFWNTRESWSFLRTLKEAFYLHKAIFKSPHSARDLRYCKYLFYQALFLTKSFRREIKRSVARTEILELDREAVYGLYARAMNDLENWTGQYHSQELKGVKKTYDF